MHRKGVPSRRSSEGEEIVNYDVYAGSAAYARPDARAQFIRRTYEHLAFALLGFLVLEFALLNLPGVERLVGLMTTGVNWLLVIGLFVVAGWIADRWARSEASRGLQYVGLALYVLIEAVIFLPLLFIAVYLTDDPTV